MGNIRNVPPSTPRKGQPVNESGDPNVASVLVDSEWLKFEKKRIRRSCYKFAEIAYSMGETNDVDEFADEMAENILESFKKVESKQKKNKK